MEIGKPSEEVIVIPKEIPIPSTLPPLPTPAEPLPVSERPMRSSSVGASGACPRRRVGRCTIRPGWWCSRARS